MEINRDLAGKILTSSFFFCSAVELRWSEPDAVEVEMKGFSLNKAVLIHHCGGDAVSAEFLAGHGGEGDLRDVLREGIPALSLASHGGEGGRSGPVCSISAAWWLGLLLSGVSSRSVGRCESASSPLLRLRHRGGGRLMDVRRRSLDWSLLVAAIGVDSQRSVNGVFCLFWSNGDLGIKPPLEALLSKPCVGARQLVLDKWFVPRDGEMAGGRASSPALGVSRARNLHDLGVFCAWRSPAIGGRGYSVR